MYTCDTRCEGVLHGKDVAAHLLDPVVVDTLDGSGRADQDGRHWWDHRELILYTQ